MSGKWLHHSSPNPNSKLNLICFPAAGGSASIYHGWPQALPNSVEVLAVRLPGRGARIKEPAFESIPKIVAQISDELKSVNDKPLAIYGHSFGGLLAFETARRASLQNFPMAFLALSGMRAAHLPDRRNPIHALNNRGFMREVEMLKGTPPEILAQEELIKIVLPALRADFTAIENYQFTEGPKLTCPIYAFCGLQDDLVSEGEINAWQDHTSGIFNLQMLPSGHHFDSDAKGMLLQALSEAIRDSEYSR
ncbi:MAG: alpha/beta fold hydrolase [Chloroflexota bacterium]